jgi:DNA invertase Pin-like site-specific DNA recombinase
VFEVHFEKNRGLYGDDVKPFEAALHFGDGQEMSWSTRSIEQSTSDKVVTLFNDGVKQNDIAEELGIDKSNVSRHIKRARETGLLDREHQQ